MIGLKCSVWICLATSVFLLISPVQEARAVPQLTLSWDDNANNEIGFSIERTRTADGMGTLLFAPANPQGGHTVYYDTDVDAGSEYCYRVRAFNNDGVSANSNVACGIP